MKRFLVILLSFFWVTTATANNAQIAYLRLVYAVPDSPPVDIWLGQQLLVEQVKFTDITDYLAIPAQAQTLKIISHDSLLLETTLKPEAQQNYTLAVTGKLILLETVLLQDNHRAPAPGMTQLRVIHLSPHAPTLDMLGKNGVEAMLFNEVGFKEAAHYIPLHAGSYDFTLQVADTNITALNTSPMELVAGQVYSLFIMNAANNSSDLQVIQRADTFSSKTKPAPIAAAITKPHTPAPSVAEFAMMTHKAKPTSSPLPAKPIVRAFKEAAPEAMPVTGAPEITQNPASTPLQISTPAPSPAPLATFPLIISLVVIISILTVGAKTLQKDPRQTRQRDLPPPTIR